MIADCFARVKSEFTVEETSSITKDRPCWLSDAENRHGYHWPTADYGKRYIIGLFGWQLVTFLVGQKLKPTPYPTNKHTM